jgi:hypothetical protein
LRGDGILEEAELVQLNEQIAFLHQGPSFDVSHVRETYSTLFRSALSPDGSPVTCEVFCAYTRKVLEGLDSDRNAQEMILEQWVAEAQVCKDLFGEATGKEVDPAAWAATMTAASAPATASCSRGGVGSRRQQPCWLDGAAVAGSPSETDTCPGTASASASDGPLSDSDVALDSPSQRERTEETTETASDEEAGVHPDLARSLCEEYPSAPCLGYL